MHFKYLMHNNIPQYLCVPCGIWTRLLGISFSISFCLSNKSKLGLRFLYFIDSIVLHRANWIINNNTVNRGRSAGVMAVRWFPYLLWVIKGSRSKCSFTRRSAHFHFAFCLNVFRGIVDNFALMAEIFRLVQCAAQKMLVEKWRVLARISSLCVFHRNVAN